MSKQQIIISESSKPVFRDGKYFYTLETQDISGQFVGEYAISDAQSFLSSYTLGSTTSWSSDGGFSTGLQSTNVIVSDASINTTHDRICSYKLSLTGKYFASGTSLTYSENITTQIPMEKYNIIEVPQHGSVAMSKGLQTTEVSLSGTYEGDEFDDDETVMRNLATVRIHNFIGSYIGIVIENSITARAGNASYSARVIMDA